MSAHSVEDLSIKKTRIRVRSYHRSVDRKCRRHKLWVPVSAVQWATCPLVEECQWMAACNPSLSFTAHPRFFPLCCCYTTALSPSCFSPSRISVVLSHHLSLEDRRTDERLSRARNAPFLFFTSEVPRRKRPRYPRAFLSPALPGNKTAATKRIDASRCKFVLFFTAGVISRRHSLRLVSSHLASLYTAC